MLHRKFIFNCKPSVAPTQCGKFHLSLVYRPFLSIHLSQVCCKKVTCIGLLYIVKLTVLTFIIFIAEKLHKNGWCFWQHGREQWCKLKCIIVTISYSKWKVNYSEKQVWRGRIKTQATGGRNILHTLVIMLPINWAPTAIKSKTWQS